MQVYLLLGLEYPREEADILSTGCDLGPVGALHLWVCVREYLGLCICSLGCLHSTRVCSPLLVPLLSWGGDEWEGDSTIPWVVSEEPIEAAVRNVIECSVGGAHIQGHHHPDKGCACDMQHTQQKNTYQLRIRFGVLFICVQNFEAQW